MAYLMDPKATRGLTRALARRGEARLEQLRETLGATLGPAPELALLDALGDTIRGDRRRGERILGSGTLRGLLATLEAGLGLLEGTRSLRLSRGGPARERARTHLFGLLAATPYLREAVPDQVPDGAFGTRSRRIARRVLAQARADIPAALGALVAGRVTGRFPLVAREDPEQARRPGEHPLGGTALVLRVPPRRRALLELSPEALAVWEGRECLLRVAWSSLGPCRGRGARLAELPAIDPGSAIRVTRCVESRPRRLRTGAWEAQAGPRLGAALSLVRRVWPEAAREIETFTERVAPLVELGTCGCSLAARPGFSYINMEGKTLLELADDLLHEAARHKLHAFEELESPGLEDDGERWWSPWRQAWRPLRGIVHGCYSFTHAALLYARLLGSEDPAAAGAARRVFLAGRLLEQEQALRFSLEDLAEPRARSLLGGWTRSLVEELASTLDSRIEPAAREASRYLAGAGAGGRRVLARRAAEARALARARRPAWQRGDEVGSRPRPGRR